MQQYNNDDHKPTSDRDRFRSASLQFRSGPLLRSVGEDHGAITLRRRVALEIRARAGRKQFLETSLFSDPAWDILLELFAAELDGRRLAVSAVGLSSAVPATTAIRWLSALQQHGLVVRVSDPNDARRSFLSLSEKGTHAMRCYFEKLTEGM